MQNVEVITVDLKQAPIVVEKLIRDVKGSLSADDIKFLIGSEYTTVCSYYLGSRATDCFYTVEQDRLRITNYCNNRPKYKGLIERLQKRLITYFIPCDSWPSADKIIEQLITNRDKDLLNTSWKAPVNLTLGQLGIKKKGP